MATVRRGGGDRPRSKIRARAGGSEPGRRTKKVEEDGAGATATRPAAVLPVWRCRRRRGGRKRVARAVVGGEGKKKIESVG